MLDSPGGKAGIEDQDWLFLVEKKTAGKDNQENG